MSIFYLPRNASKARLRDAENARKNRAEILKAYSHGTVSRRDLIKWGLITGAGLIAPIGGLSPFVAYASDGGEWRWHLRRRQSSAFQPVCRPVLYSVCRRSPRRCHALTLSHAIQCHR